MHVVIIGNGIAGVSAALQVRSLEPTWRITMISGESQYHYSRPALMYVYMGHMRYQDTKPYEDSFWAQQRIELLRDWVTAIDTGQRRLQLHRSPALSYDRLLLATGSKSNRFAWKGQELGGVQGLYDLMDLDLLRRNTEHCRQAVLVGGGLVGIELAEMLHSQGIAVTFLVREAGYWGDVLPPEESAMIHRVIRQYGFDLRLATALAEIVDDGRGRVGAVRTDKGELLPCQLVGLTAGVSPNLDPVRGTSIATGRGILVDRSFRSSVDGVFAAGDCAEIQSDERQPNLLQQVWYTGKAQGTVAGTALAGRPCAYDPGIWFNSAKFLDLEYQVYGQVHTDLPGERSLYWEHSNHRHCLRIAHVDGVVIGLHVLGLRYRHEVCQRWLQEQRSVDFVLEHLTEGNFDPEFFRRHELEIVPTLRSQFRSQLQASAR